LEGGRKMAIEPSLLITTVQRRHMPPINPQFPDSLHSNTTLREQENSQQHNRRIP
jgi:hypothetical protein